MTTARGPLADRLEELPAPRSQDASATAFAGTDPRVNPRTFARTERRSAERRSGSWCYCARAEPFQRLPKPGTIRSTQVVAFAFIWTRAMPLGLPLLVNVALEPPATGVTRTVVMSPDQD